MPTEDRRTHPLVAVVGAGAAGTLTALHLVRTAGRRSTRVDVIVVDPADRWGTGVAYSTTDDRHLLNVPAAGMSALPEEPGHFVEWLRLDRPGTPTEPSDFVARRTYARYLDDCLRDAVARSGGDVCVRHERSRAVTLRRTPSGAVLGLATGQELVADAVVLACGTRPPSVGWAPDTLRDSAFFVADPWAPGAVDVVRRSATGPSDVLLVGTGLTMVDVATTLGADDRPAGRRVHAVSRHGRLPRAHRPGLRLAAIPDITEWGDDLDGLRARVRDHLVGVTRSTGDWRPGIDGLRVQAAALWERLGEADRQRFLSSDATAWNVLRHRMPPESAARVRGMLADGALDVRAATIATASALPEGGLRVGLADGTSLDVGWVVNCTGPAPDLARAGDPLIDDLITPRAGVALATLATAGMGFRTRHGRLLDSQGTADAPVWTLGSLRRGELWESTAVPEIRAQAFALAASVLDEVAPLPRRLADGRVVSGRHPIARPRDPLGLPLSTTADAAAAYNAGLERLMRLQSGADELLHQATVLDPDFGLAHAALAMLGHEAGADVDVQGCLDEARRAVRVRGDDRERSLVDVVGLRVHDVRGTGARSLMAHIADHPRDVLAVSAAVPTIAFSGVTDVQQEAWELVEGLAPAYGDHWWYISLLAFTRQDQSRFDDAGLLAESALSCEPSSGHAVHAQTHVMYETGQHDAGRTWLDHWVDESGRSASHRAHFSWHAALHELAVGDTEAVRRRYYSQLAPPTVLGVRALIDSAALLWRWKVTTSGWDAGVTLGLDTASDAFAGEGDPPPVASVLDALDPVLLDEPATPFVALHAAIALAAAGDAARLARLGERCRRSSDPTIRAVVASVCTGLVAVVEERWDDAWRLLIDVLPVLARVGGSAAQREVVEETLLYCLVCAGEAERALAFLDARLDRRDSPLDSRRRASLRLPGRPAHGEDAVIGTR